MGGATMSRAPALVLLLAGALLQDGSRTAESRIEAGDHRGAAAEYRALLADEPSSQLLRYNLGTSLLRGAEHDSARAHLEAAARGADPEIRFRAHYNLGNVDLEPAYGAEPSPERREALLRAVAGYREALLLRSADTDAKWNLEVALRLLREDDPPAAGGGGGEGGGGGADEDRGRPDPEPAPGDEGGPSPAMSPERAEQILAAAERRELGVQREKLQKQQPPRIAH
jgi:tetratricopeptide (TPR) repeat protein